MLKGDLLENYKAAIADPDLHNFNQESAVLRGMEMDLLSQIEHGASAELYKQLIDLCEQSDEIHAEIRKAFEDRRRAFEEIEDEAKRDAAVKNARDRYEAGMKDYFAIVDLIKKKVKDGAKDRDLRDQAVEIMIQKADMSERASRHLERQGFVMGVEAAVQLAGSLMEAVRDKVKDQATIAAIGAMFSMIMKRTEGRPGVASGEEGDGEERIGEERIIDVPMMALPQPQDNAEGEG